MKVVSFYCEHKKGSIFKGKTARDTAFEYAVEVLNENYKNGFTYKCNYDSVIEVKPGFWRRIVRRKKEDAIKIKYKYGIFQKESETPNEQFKFIEVEPVYTKDTLSILAKKGNHSPFIEAGQEAIIDYFKDNPKIVPYCDLEVMVRIKRGCFPKIFNNIRGKSYKNKFSFDYFEFNIAQEFF